MGAPDHAATLPRLRPDLRLADGPEPGAVIVHDPVTGAAHLLRELDGLVVTEIDRARDLDDLARRTQQRFPAATHEQVASAVRQMAGMGLLRASREPSSTARPAAAGGTVLPLSPPGEAGPGWAPARRAWWAHPRARRALRPCAVVLALAALAATPYPRYVTEPCAVLPARRLEVRARVEGLLAEALVDEGSRVRAGEVVARLEDRQLEASLQRAGAEVDRLAAIVAKMRAGSRAEEIARAEAAVEGKARALRWAETTAARQLALFQRHLVSASDRDQALRDRAEKAGELALARADLRLLRSGFRREEIQSAEADLRRAQLEVASLQRRSDLLTIAAPIDGVVVTPRFRERLHERLEAGETVCEIADLGRAEVEIYVPERDFDALAVGQPTTVKVQSFPLHPFTGRVTFIGLAVEERAGERVVRALTVVDNSAGLLREHMTGYGEIDTGRSHLATLALRRLVRWIRVRFLV